MKKKLDFITNSSSTSFIICTSNDEALKVPMQIEVDLNKYVEKKISTVKELRKYWLEDRYDDEEDEQFIKCMKMLEEGKIVYFLHCSDEEFDDPLESLLCHQGLNNLTLPEGIEVILGEGGY